MSAPTNEKYLGRRKMKKYYFFLGGSDAEMVEIKKILSENNIPFSDKNLGWGAKASAYAEEIISAKKGKLFPVFVELENDINYDGTIVDHHGSRAGEQPSIIQVLNLLGLIKPTRWQKLIGANDAGYIPAMVAIGATEEEIKKVRLADRTAQGITPEQEREAERAIAAYEVSGRLTIVHMAHSKCATVTDRLFGKYDQLLILSSDGEVNFFGDGALCVELKEKFQGWNGGSGLGKKGENAYWGGYPRIESFVKQALG
ncbi:MAG: hypothetical protein UW92_C0004G0013 [Candidatus Jorgensenbacteria bacterium GW2011_GWA2_45_13]|uniref:Uncharacterized protein n=1 Tax=Candidatus Jorgensenbacteria bacterium GW2011_GWA2_45_13 TaxID=1618662 RepID=A0A0G1L8N8_9BACT|nr:MAG: hypothetical protein UW92_C0004G0013 [Candidatus Jorgensenbacteria bacterium GW2011_GWA2_45_13]